MAAVTGPTVVGVAATSPLDQIDLKATQPVEELGFDPVKLKERYVAERNVRLQNGGVGQYRAMEGALKSWIQDPYVEPGFSRDPVDLDLDAVIIGGGYGGLLIAARLVEQGVTNFRIIEKGGDFGGTWYWNRYPGAQCDIEAYIYMPLLEETGYVPSEKYAHAPELVAHAKKIGREYDLYSRTLFQTEVHSLRWNDSGTWSIETSHQDKIRTRFVIPVCGTNHRPRLPGLEVEKFQGPSFHTSRWDYSITGGDNSGHLAKLADKRVGIIGTGATAIQVVPHLGEWAKELYVFQRTPSSIDRRGNKPTDPKWAKSLKRGWQQERALNFTTILNGGYQERDLVDDAWTDIFKLFRLDPLHKATDPEAAAAELQMVNFKKMEAIRGRVDSIVKDKHTADALKPWYNYFCKRPCCHDEYLPTFNRPNVHLVDTQGRGVQAITEKGILANEKEYELDLIVYATGFDWTATDFSKRSGIEVYGRDGMTLSKKWAEGALTFHGWATRGFPNCLFQQLAQGAQAGNHTHVMSEVAGHIAYVVSQCLSRGVKTMEPIQEAETQWVNEVVDKARVRGNFLAECTPSYLNDEGNISLKSLRNCSYGGGPSGSISFWNIMKKWREDGKLEGLEVTYRDERQ